MLDMGRIRPLLRAHGISRARALFAGEMRIKACWVALHLLSRAAFALKSSASSGSAALSAVSILATHTMVLSGQILTPR